MDLNVMNACMTIIIIVTLLYVLFIWFLGWLSKKQEPRCESMEKKRRVNTSMNEIKQH
jgi:hypothetical protein